MTALVVVALAAACGSGGGGGIGGIGASGSGSGPDDGMAAPVLAGSDWRAEEIGGGPVLDRAQPTLAFADGGGVAGTGGCNRYFGSVTIAGDRIRFGDLGSTMMACPPAIMDQEQRFHAALKAAQRFRVDGPTGKLILLGADDKPEARFARIDG